MKDEKEVKLRALSFHYYQETQIATKQPKMLIRTMIEASLKTVKNLMKLRLNLLMITLKEFIRQAERVNQVLLGRQPNEYRSRMQC